MYNIAPRNKMEICLIKSIRCATLRSPETDQDVIDMIKSIDYFTEELKKLFPGTFQTKQLSEKS